MLLAHLVSGRYGSLAVEDRPAAASAAIAKAGWFSRFFAFFGARR